MRPGFIAPALLAIPLFAVTNADDLVLLTIFFANPRNKTNAIVWGQLVGIGALTLASILAASLALQLPENWLPWLGLVPVALGIRAFFSSDDEEEQNLPPALSWTAIAAITVANGGDNLAVYIPVFANQTALGIAIISVMFGILTLAWCGIARQITRHPTWGTKVQRAANVAAPYALIAVGLWVVSKHAWVQSILGFSN